MQSKRKDDLSDREKLVDYISNCKAITPTKAFFKLKEEIDFGDCKVFGDKNLTVVIGDKKRILQAIHDKQDLIENCHFEYFGANCGVPLADLSYFDARIEPFAVVRDKTEIGKNAVVLMGAVINVGAKIGEKTMVDMNAVVGSNAIVGKGCHVGAGAVLAGVLEPPDSNPVVVEDYVTLGANCVVLEGRRVGHHAVVGAGAVVTKDIPPFGVATGCPAVVKKYVDEKTAQKTATEEKLRGKKE